MRIISKFYDYYDKALAYGIDENLPYIRERSDLYIPAIVWREPQKCQDRQRFEAFTIAGTIAENNPSPSNSYLICFCGKIYPVYSVCFSGNVYAKNWKYYYSVESLKRDINNKEFVYALYDKYDRWVISNQIDSIKRRLLKKNCFSKDPIKDIADLDKFIGKSIGDDLFRYYDSPVIIITARTNAYDLPIIINPCLKDFDFVKVVDPVTAFQEISMYLGSNLAKQKDPEVNHSDELKAEIHGFNKWSFRKQGKNNK